MKKYLFIALAAIAALSSCSKENLVANEENGKEAQVFTATMEDGITSKATFDQTNKCALWEVGDIISIDGHEYTANQAGASSTFTGSGATETTHHAYFPAGLYNSGTPTLPAEQAYEADKFNMPMYAESSSLDLSFKNLCAVLAITVNKSNLVSTTTTSLKSIKVSSDKRMNGAFTATAAGVLKFTSEATLTDADKSVTLNISESVDVSTAKTFYIAIPAQEYSYLKIYLSADGTTYKEAMITQKAAGLGTIARSTMFNIPYKTNAVQLYSGGPYWATMNIGAKAPTDYGWYFSWGNTTGYVFDSTNKWVKASDNTTKLGTNGSFSLDNYNDVTVSGKGSTLTGDIPFDADYDAAYANWGAAWKMPAERTGGFNELTNNTTNEWVSEEVKGRKFTGMDSYSDIILFFPVTGYAKNTGRYSTAIGFYWSSSWEEEPGKAGSCRIIQTGVRDGIEDRFQGFCVRPVSD